MADINKIRNVAILGHAGSGKTSLAEAFLFNTKAVNRLGNVQDGNTVSDYEPEETKRSSSIQTSLLPCVTDGYKVNVLDTPGYDDFVSEVIAALRVVEGAVIVLPASAGVEVGAIRSWNQCVEAGIPRMILVNKMDRENSDFQRCLEDIRSNFGRGCVPFQIPIGAEQNFQGVVNVLDQGTEAPPEVAAQVEEARDMLIEAVAETDDDLATKYLEGEDLTQEEVTGAVREAILSGHISPVFVGSATMNLGMEELLEGVTAYMGSPVERANVPLLDSDMEATADAGSGPLAAFVFKTTADPFVGKLSLFRVFSGTVRSNSEVWNEARNTSERIGQVYTIRGKNQEQTADVGAGDMGAVSKLAATVTSDTLTQKENATVVRRIDFPSGFYTMAVQPKSKADVDKMSMALSRVLEEDPSLNLTREPNTGETLVSGFGETQLEVAMERVKRKFGTELELHLPKVPYKETISTMTKAEYKHKKQTGGHGQYGHVLLRLEPTSADQTYEFGQELVGGSIPKEYVPSVEKGVAKALQEGVLGGFPVVGVKAVLYDGSFHDVDSSGICFEIAGSYALRKGVSEAGPKLLEPIMRLSVRVPDAFNGDVIGDLNSKRGRIMGMTPQNGETIIEAEAPQSELLRYATDLRSLTQGRGSFVTEFDRYEEAPAHITQKVTEEAKKAKEAARA